MRTAARPSGLASLALLLTACGGGGGSNSPLSNNVAPELVVARARVDDPHRFAELSLRTTRNLGTARIGDRVGPEERPRLHPDGVRVVFVRRRLKDDGDSRELFVSTIDGSAAELRLTVDLTLDQHPVWSPDGERVLFESERGGTSGLWTIGATGSDPQPFAAATGFEDFEPDWHAASDRVVFSRRDGSGLHTLWLVNGSGAGAFQLTDAGTATGAGNGDGQPAFSPDGTMIVFLRRTAVDRAVLCTCEVSSGIVTEVFAPDADLWLPRYSPSMDRFWFGLAEPDVGRQTMRLANMPVGGGTPTLVWPDERWEYRGLDFLPAATPLGPAAPAQRLNVREATVQVAMASDVFGARSQLDEDDGDEFYLRSAESGSGQVAAINCRFDLPVEQPEDVLEVRVRARVRASNVAGDSLLRMSLRNLTDNRYDTVVELTPSGTDEQTMEFRTSSLRHITREKVLQFTVIADLDIDEAADFWIDQVEVEILPRQPPGP